MAIAELLDRCSFPEGELHLGVSGGTDSVAMAVLARASGRPFTIWHVDHGVRPSAADDAAFVRDLAADWGVPFELRELRMEPTPNFEAVARTRRYEMLPEGVCVAHTANDRAETVLLNLFRGAGLAGTAARMEQAHRPILTLTRADTVAVCDEAGITPCEDETNEDVRNHRAAVRYRLLPEIARSLGRDPVPILNRHADLVADALALVEAAAAELDPTDVHVLRDAPRAVTTEALRRWIQAESGDPYPVDVGTIERVLEVVYGNRRAAETLGGHRIARSKGRLSFSVASPDGQART
ncbi:MAG: tRNA lysidine(34) synthetase TilS [Actinomycetota bacterium]